jgi:GTPase involved in cell partitioning and DNA repair
MLNRTKLIIALGAASIALVSAPGFAREAAEGPRGADRPGDVRKQGADDAVKTPVVTPVADNHGGKTTPDDNNKNKGAAGNAGGKGGADDPAGHH